MDGWVSVYDQFYCTAAMNGAFTLPDTETETDKMGTKSNGIWRVGMSVSVV